MRIFLAITSSLVFASAMSLAQAGVIEDLLALPAIQSLLSRQPELQAAVQKCSDAKYRQRNVKICQQAEEASRLTKVPAELRAVLSNPPAAASIREVCLAVQGGPAQNSYLCAELSKAETGFKTLVEQRREAIEAAKRPNFQDAAPGK